MKNFRRYKTILISLSIVIILALIISFVILVELARKVDSNSRENMELLVSHDMRAIEYIIDTRYTNLGVLSASVIGVDFSDDSIDFIKYGLDDSLGFFHTFAFLLEDGTLLTSKGDKLDGSLYLDILYDKGRILSYDCSGFWHEPREASCIIQGIAIDDVTVGGKQAVALLADSDCNELVNYSNLKDQSLESFSLVMDSNGDIIFGNSDDKYYPESRNLYAALCEVNSDNYTRMSDFKEKVDDTTEDVFIDNILGHSGKEYYCVVCHSDNTDWNYVMFESKAVHKNMLAQYLVIAVMIVVLDVFTVLLLIHMLKGVVREQRSMHQKSAFLANMSHEIRGPLNGLIGLNYLMQNNLDDKEKMEEYLIKSKNAANYLKSLVDGILDLYKVQDHIFEVSESNFVLSEEIENIVTMQIPSFESKGVNLIIHKDIMYDEVYGDILHIKQILMNVLGNSVKYTNRDGHVHMTVSQRKKGDIIYTSFAIADDGCGIDSEMQKVIFESFLVGRDDIADDNMAGKGIGMPISYHIAKELGGTIELDSEPGKGSVFTITIPLKRAMEIDSSNMIFEEKALVNDSLRILLAEDNDLNAEIMEDILKDEGIAVKRVVNGQEAVNEFAKSAIGEYNVILMDIRMPILNGYDASKMIRSLDREDASSVVIIACSANAHKEDMEKAKNAGMNNFLAKPVNVVELFGILKDENR